MAHRDVADYVDLTVHDLDPQDIFDDAKAQAEANWPDWQPREANVEVQLMEALAYAVWPQTVALNRLPGAIVDVLLRLFGIEFDTGTPPVADIRFVLSDTASRKIPKGTTVRLEYGAGEELLFDTDAELITTAGDGEGTTAATAQTATADANGTVSGTAVDMVDAVTYVESAELATDVSAGTDPETTAEWRDRAITRLSRLVTTLLLPKHFDSAALEDTAVARAKTVDNYDPGQAGNPGDHGGHISVYVVGDNGALLTQATKDDIDADLQAKAAANLAVHVVDPTVTSIDVTATVTHKPGETAATVDTAIVDAVTAYLDPDSWPWADVVRQNELIALVDGVAGVDYVTDMQLAISGDPLGTADVTLSGVANLTSAGTINATVNAP